MVHPIVVYGDPVLRKKAQDIPQGEDISRLVADMYETMYAAEGMGLAAPQIGKSIRLFVVDTTMVEDEPDLKDFKQVFVNAHILETAGEEESQEEGCLSIPNIREQVVRDTIIRMKWFDEKWNAFEGTFTGWRARVIQHEYDHIEGTLFIDHLNPLRKRLLKGKLTDISKGLIKAGYRIAPPRK